MFEQLVFYLMTFLIIQIIFIFQIHLHADIWIDVYIL